MNTFGYERRNRKVFRRCLKTESDNADVMSGSSSFQACLLYTSDAADE